MIASALSLICILLIALVVRDGKKRTQRAGNYFVTDGAGFSRFEHSKAEAEAWQALGYTVTKLR